jgi:hypothetical protein
VTQNESLPNSAYQLAQAARSDSAARSCGESVDVTPGVAENEFPCRHRRRNRSGIRTNPRLGLLRWLLLALLGFDLACRLAVL